MFRRVTSLAFALLLSVFISGAHAEICNQFTSDITHESCVDGYVPPCICLNTTEPYCHEVWTLEWECTSDIAHQVDCGWRDCTNASHDNDTTIHCDTQWCGEDQWRHVYGPKVYCNICIQ